jgi:hypothetical protein
MLSKITVFNQTKKYKHINEKMQNKTILPCTVNACMYHSILLEAAT